MTYGHNVYYLVSMPSTSLLAFRGAVEKAQKLNVTKEAVTSIVNEVFDVPVKSVNIPMVATTNNPDRTGKDLHICQLPNLNPHYFQNIVSLLTLSP